MEGEGLHTDREEQAEDATSSFRKEVEVTDAKACRISKRKKLFQRDEWYSHHSRSEF